VLAIPKTLLREIEELEVAELSLLSEKIQELVKRKEEKTRFYLLQKNADKAEPWLQKIEGVLASFQERHFDPNVSILAKVIKETFGIIFANTQINAWLKHQGLLSEIEGQNGKKRTVLNEKSGEYGMYAEKKTLATGFVVDVIQFSPKGVRFILEHLKEIVIFAG
jgi:hypothetical protein